MKTETMAVIGIVFLVAISLIVVVAVDDTTGQTISLKVLHPVPAPIPGRNTHAIELRAHPAPTPIIPGRNTHAIDLTGPSASST